MKKNGFTLAETVITMAVIGVVAAISLPLINSFRIDENKVLFLRAYDAIVEATQMIISNSEMYPPIGSGDRVLQDNGEPEANPKTYDFSECPLLNITHEYILENVKIGNVTKNVTCGGSDLNGMNKFSKLLAYAIGIPGTDVHKSSDITLTLRNGVGLWLNDTAITSDYLSNRIPDDSAGKFMYLTEIKMDVNDRVYPFDENKGYNNNCFYDKTECPHPDQFLLYVTADGQVHAIDPMAQYYLKTRSNLRLNKETLDTNKYKDLTSYKEDYLKLERPAVIQ